MLSLLVIVPSLPLPCSASILSACWRHLPMRGFHVIAVSYVQGLCQGSWAGALNDHLCKQIMTSSTLQLYCTFVSSASLESSELRQTTRFGMKHNQVLQHHLSNIAQIAHRTTIFHRRSTQHRFRATESKQYVVHRDAGLAMHC